MILTLMKRFALISLTLAVAGGPLALAASSAPATPDAAQRTEITTVDDWEVTCAFDKGNRKVGCNAVLRVTQPGAPATGNEPARPDRVFIVWALSRAADGRVYSSFQTLTGVRVQPGLQLKFDSTAPRTIPFDSCGATFCVAIAAMDPQFLTMARGVSQIQATVQATDGRAYTATFAPKGIDRAISAVL